MMTSLWSVAVTLALGANPAYPPGTSPAGDITPVSYGAIGAAPVSYGQIPASPVSCNNCNGGYGAGYGGDYSYGTPMGGGYGGAVSYGSAYPGDEPMFPFDTQMNWMHGHFQEIPAYGGFVYFRPYNYKHVLSQSQVAAGWGLSPTMPYSQQFWHRFQQQAAMSQQMSSYRSGMAAPVSRFNAPPAAAPIIRAQETMPASYVAPASGPVIQPQISAGEIGAARPRFPRTPTGAIELAPGSQSARPR